MSERLKFIEAATLPGANISDLCAEFGLSRQTGYKWLRRYEQHGYAGLVDQSRRPLTTTATAEAVVKSILALRARRASWGPKKIALILKKELGGDGPSASTVARVLRRAGRIKRRRPAVRLWCVEGKPYVEVHAPNDLWTIDFKGWWRTGDGRRCEPLTVRDAFSRRVLIVRIGATTKGREVRRTLQALFEQHGVPRAIQVDNGSPWVSARSRGGLTQLSVWLVSLGVRLVRSRPATPSDNGGHERMHRDLAELQFRPAKSRRAQQLECDRWVIDFNNVRPHDALGGRTPAEVYRVESKKAPVVKIPTYPAAWKTRRVMAGGMICVDGDTILIGAALRGHRVGLRHERGLRWRAFFFEVDLGLVEIASFDAASVPDAPTEVSPKLSAMS